MPTFTDNWVKKAEDHEDNWRQWTAHLHAPRILEVGSFEGRSALLWRRIFPESTVHCVDIFAGEHERVHPGYSARFDENTKHDRSIFKHAGPSNVWLTRFLAAGDKFDVIYIDGDHNGDAVYADALGAWPLLHADGVLIFDDYEWYYTTPPPKDGIDRFLSEAKGYDLLGKGWQVAIRRMV